MKTAGFVLVTIIALASLVFIGSSSISPLAVKTSPSIDPADYRLGNNCYIGYKMTQKTVEGKRLKFQETLVSQKYDYYINQRGYHVCGTLKKEDPKHTHYFLCPPLSKCFSLLDDFRCIQKKIEEVEYCDT